MIDDESEVFFSGTPHDAKCFNCVVLVKKSGGNASFTILRRKAFSQAKHDSIQVHFLNSNCHFFNVSTVPMYNFKVVMVPFKTPTTKLLKSRESWLILGAASKLTFSKRDFVVWLKDLVVPEFSHSGCSINLNGFVWILPPQRNRESRSWLASFIWRFLMDYFSRPSSLKQAISDQNNHQIILSFCYY